MVIDKVMATLKTLINDKLNSIAINSYDKRRELFITDIKDKIQILQSFVDDNREVIEDILSANDDVIAFNKFYGRYLDLNILCLLTIENIKDNVVSLNFFTHRNIGLRVEYNKGSNTLTTRFKFNDIWYGIKVLMEFVLVNKLQFDELRELHSSLCDYVVEFNERLKMYNKDKNLKTIFEDKINSLGE